MYNVKSSLASEYIAHEEILDSLEYAEKFKNNTSVIDEILFKAKQKRGLSHRDAAVLLACDIESKNAEIFAVAEQIKKDFYGNRIVVFAPLYLSNFCVNGCIYCPYNYLNSTIERKRLTREEIRNAVLQLQDMGHKRLMIEAAEHPIYNSIDYILEAIETIYGTKHKNGEIRRVNVKIAATTSENYSKLQNAGIGTYILLQDTYHKDNYERLHPRGPKSDYYYHTEAIDRAMAGGIGDVGIGACFSAEFYSYDFTALLMHAEHLEAIFGIGPHTISVPRIMSSASVESNEADRAIDDDRLAKIVACLRIAVPYTGMIVSTKESIKTREKILRFGASQISGGISSSNTGYTKPSIQSVKSQQFDMIDNRTLDQIVSWLIDLDYVPSFCTACYREGRTGDRFMNLCKSGQLANVCLPNSLMTLKEYFEDYATPETRAKGERLLNREMQNITNESVKVIAQRFLKSIESGKRDFRF